jgi:hypothetical protein
MSREGARWRDSAVVRGRRSDLQAGVQADLQGLCKDAGLTDRSETCETTRVERAEAPPCPPTLAISIGRYDGSGARRRPRTRGATRPAQPVSALPMCAATWTPTSVRGPSSMPRCVRTSRWHGLSRRPVRSTPLVLIRCSTAARQRPTRLTARHEIPCALGRNAPPIRPATRGPLLSSVGVGSSGSREPKGRAAAVVGPPDAVRP